MFNPKRECAKDAKNYMDFLLNMNQLVFTGSINRNRLTNISKNDILVNQVNPAESEKAG